MRYEAPTSIEAAVEVLAGQPGECHVLAGGTDLLVKLRSETIEPGAILDIKRIDELRRHHARRRRLADRRGRIRCRDGRE